MDVFIEQLVMRNKRGFEKAFRPLVLLFGFMAAVLIILTGLSMGFLSMFFIAAGIGLGYGAIYASSLFDIEFEYSVTNGYVDIDRITARRKRERLAAFECHDITSIGRYERPSDIPSNLKPLDVTGGNGEKYYIIIGGTKKSSAIIFEPDERTLDAIKKFIPRSVYIESFGNKVD